MSAAKRWRFVSRQTNGADELIMATFDDLNTRGFAWAETKLPPSGWPGPESGPSSPIRDVL